MWLMQNLGTMITGLVVFLLVFLAARNVWKNKKEGKSCCSCGSGGCGCSGCKSKVESSSAKNRTFRKR